MLKRLLKTCNLIRVQGSIFVLGLRQRILSNVRVKMGFKLSVIAGSFAALEIVSGTLKVLFILFISYNRDKGQSDLWNSGIAGALSGWIASIFFGSRQRFSTTVLALSLGSCFGIVGVTEQF